MLSAHAGPITTIKANGRMILAMAAILSVPGIIHWFSNKPLVSSTKLQAPNVKQAPSSKHQLSNKHQISNKYQIPNMCPNIRRLEFGV